jgi:predicted ATPase
MHVGKKASSPLKKYPPGSFMGKVRKRRIIETVAAFVGGGFALVEFVYHILFHYYHFPRFTVDITIAGVAVAMLCTVAWRWFRREKEEDTEESLAVSEEKTQPKRVSTSPRKHNLPEQLTSFIGRSKELETVQKLLSENRLVTLTGAGGCGKTRLATEVASTLIEKYEDGVWFVNLGPVTDPNFVAIEITDVLDIKEEPNKAITDTLIENIESKSLLILLDNCEHLVQACAEIADKLLQSVKGLRILATSREALNVPGELVWRTPSLSFPDNGAKMDIDEVLQYEAVQLFTERASTSKPGFILNPQNVSPIVQICQHVAGIPLAIELAATRIRQLSLETILERLDDQIKIFASTSRTAPKRQQTLQATIDWSYNLLTEEEQRLFNRLSVFTGDFSLESVEEICTDDEIKKENTLSLLCQLVDKSLVIAEDQEDESVRYRCLMPLHQYSLQKLIEIGEEEKYRDRHLSYYLSMAEQAYKEQFESQLKWLNKLEQEHDNLIAALNWSSAQSIEEFILLSGYLAWFWYLHSHYSLGMDYLEKALLKKTDKSEAYARVSAGLGMISHWSGDSQRAINLFNESLDIWRRYQNHLEEAIVLSLLGAYAYNIDDESGLRYNEKSLEIARKIGNPGLLNHCLVYICQRYVFSKKFDQAKSYLEELLKSSEKLEQPIGIIAAHHFGGDCALGSRNFKEAEKKYSFTITIKLKFGFAAQVCYDIQGVAFSVSGQSRWAKAIRLDAAARKVASQYGVTIDGILELWDEWIDAYIKGRTSSF